MPAGSVFTRKVRGSLKLRGPLLKVLTIRIIACLGLFLGPPFMEPPHTDPKDKTGTREQSQIAPVPTAPKSAFGQALLSLLHPCFGQDVVTEAPE